MIPKRQAARLLTILALPGCVIVPGGALELPGVALGGVGLCLVAGLWVAREVLSEFEFSGLRGALLRFATGLGCCCVSLGIAFLGCAVCRVNP